MATTVPRNWSDANGIFSWIRRGLLLTVNVHPANIMDRDGIKMFLDDQTCALLIPYDKYAASFLGMLQLACALLWFRRLHRLSRL